MTILQFEDMFLTGDLEEDREAYELWNAYIECDLQDVIDGIDEIIVWYCS